MFEFVRTHTRLLQAMLLLVIFPSFVFFGIQGYQRFGEGAAASVAQVGRQEITQGEWDNAVRRQVERVRQQAPNIDTRFLETPAMKQQVLEGLVRERVLLHASMDLRLDPSESRVAGIFKNDPRYEQARDPDGYISQAFLAGQGMTSQQFMAALRQQVAMQQVTGPITESAVAPDTAASAAVDALLQQREVQVARFEPKDFTAGVTVTDAEVKAYYEDPAQAGQYMAPESAVIEYVVLDIDAIKRDVKVSDEELRKYYEENKARFTATEERHARHILITAPASASADVRAKARAKAEAVLAQVQKNRAAFAEIAKKESQDEGSAPNGGDLDYFGRGALASKQMEDAAFGLKKGELSGVVESEYGFHIIEVLDARGGGVQSFDSVRTQVEDEVKNQLASRRYAEAAEVFTDTVFSQPDSFAPVAEKLKLEIRKSPRILRTPAAGGEGVLANPKFLQAVFKADSVTTKRNTEAVQTGPNQLASGRIVEHTPSTRLPLAAVSEQIKAAITTRKATEAARAQGQAKLEQWRKEPGAATLQPAVLLSRMQTHNLPRPLVEAVLREPADKLPAWIGVDAGSLGYIVARLNKVAGPDPAALQADPQRGKGQYARSWAQAEEHAYHASLRERLKVKITGKATGSELPDLDLDEPPPR